MKATYEHTQRSPLWWLLIVPAVIAVVGAFFQEEEGPRVALAAFAVLFGVLAGCFATLTVRDLDDRLDVRFGPLPWFGTKVAYDAMVAVEPSCSRFIDGWGIHWMPGRGWTFNLWGFDCVEVKTTKGVVRIGTDDREGLAKFLESRMRG